MEGKHKKTELLWRPPAGATQRESQAATPAADPPGSKAGHISSPATLGATVQAPTPPLKASAAPPAPDPPRDLSAPLPEGAVIGERYVVKSLAGRGGFSAVYRAADEQIPNHEVAVKLLNAPAESPAARETAMRELTLIASVSHPSVVQFKDYGWHEERLFFAMPWYRGKPLSSAVPLGRADARKVFERSAYGLQAMHDAGICHYDIKPDNIFLADIEGFEGGFPVLLDLGIAAKRGEKPTALTPDYAAPETAQSILDGGVTQVGPAADVFSLALSLRNVLEPDTVPELGDSLPAFLHQRSTVPISPPAHKDLQYLKPLFERWLNIDPAQRPTAAELAVQLAALTAPEERRAERRRLLLRIVPVVLVLGLIAAVLALQLRTTTAELVQQKQVGEQQSAAANQRFEKLKAESKDQLDEKLLLAQEFQAQRDQFRVQRDETRASLDATTGERDRARADLKTRTHERDQTRRDLDARTLELQTTAATLEQRNKELEGKSRELAQARADLQARAQDLEKRTKERDSAQAELAKQSKKLQEQDKALAAQKAQLSAQAAELLASKAELKQARADLTQRAKELEQAKKERDKAKREADQRAKERDAARAEVESLERDLKRMAADLAKARKEAAAAQEAARKAEAKARKTEAQDAPRAGPP